MLGRQKRVLLSRPEVEDVVGETEQSPGESLVRRVELSQAPTAGTDRRVADSGVMDRESRAEADAEKPFADRRPDYIYHRLFAGSDIASIVLASGLASVLTGALGRVYDVEILFATVAIMIPVWFVIAYGAGLYHGVESRVNYSYADEIGRIMTVATAWAWFFVLVRSVLASGGTDLLTPAVIWLLMIPLFLFGRALVRRHARRQPWSRRNVATIGHPADVESLARRIERHSEWGLDIRLQVLFDENGNFVDRSSDGSTESDQLSASVREQDNEIGLGETLGHTRERELAGQLDRLGISRAMIVGGSLDLSERTKLIHELIEAGIAVDQVSSGPETLYTNAILHDLEGLPVLSLSLIHI